MRVMSILVVLSSCGVAVVGVMKNTDLYGLSALVATMLAVAFGGKVAQKRFEKRD